MSGCTPQKRVTDPLILQPNRSNTKIYLKWFFKRTQKKKLLSMYKTNQHTKLRNCMTMDKSNKKHSSRTIVDILHTYAWCSCSYNNITLNSF